MNRKTLLLIAVLFAGAFLVHGEGGFKEIKEDDVLFQWKIEGEFLHIKLTAPAEGWVSVGFNPSKMMKDADYKLAYVDGTTVYLVDHYGNGLFSHKSDRDMGGTEDFELIGGSERNGFTTVEFRMPLDSGDEFDSPLKEGEETKVLLAYANTDNISRKHNWRTSVVVRL